MPYKIGTSYAIDRVIESEWKAFLMSISSPSHFRYVHRVGRTARAGCGGRSVTFVGDARRKVMKDVLKGDGDESTGKVDRTQ